MGGDVDDANRGLRPFPIILGHEFSGEVLAVGPV
jgi:threonine dehydrogenase-like Zn-dependent dehydrogenase